jgi:predicted RNase H-like HicB family nuclease
MQTTLLRYHVVIYKEGNQYIADVPTLSISDFGRTVELAKSNVQSAILCHLEGLRKTNTLIPPPDTDDLYVGSAEVSFSGPIHFAC